MKSVPQIQNLEIQEIEKDILKHEETVVHSDSSEEKQKVHPVKKLTSSSSSLSSDLEEEKVPMKEQDIPGLPKLNLKFSEYTPPSDNFLVPGS